MLAAQSMSGSIFQLLVDNGSNPHCVDKSGNTALILAASHAYEDSVEPLLEAGANPNHSNNDGDTALICAEHYLREHFVRLLLDAGANPTHENNSSDTPLSVAATGYGNPDKVVQLLKKRIEDWPQLQATGNNPTSVQFPQACIRNTQTNLSVTGVPTLREIALRVNAHTELLHGSA